MRCLKPSFAVLLLAAIATAAMGQDLVSVAPNKAKVEYEDAHVRVVRLKIAPHESLPMHDRPARVVITLTRNDVVLTAPGGAKRTLHVPAGEIAWSGPGRRSVTNLDAPLENVIVEIKDYREPAIPASNPPAASDPRALVEPHHKLVIDNQYVRVYDVHVPPGEMTGFHHHGYGTVILWLSGGRIADQHQGEPWGKDQTFRADSVEFHDAASKPYTHRVRNDGKQDFHVVLVTLMR